MWEPSIDTALEHEEGSTRRLEVNGGYLYQVKMVIEAHEVETSFIKDTSYGRPISTLVGKQVFWSAPVFVPGYDKRFPTTYAKGTSG